MEPRAVLAADDIDLSDMEFWARPWDEREGAFQTLRRERPMPFYEEPEIPEALALVIPKGPGYYALTRHAHITEASRHPEIFQSGQGATSIIDMPEEMLDFFGSMINMDNPRHARLRRIVSAAFNPRMIKSIEDRIDFVANDVIDRVAAAGGCDFVVEVAARLPLEIICDMMGIAASDYDTVFNASNVILSSGDTEYVPEGADPMAAFMMAAQQLNMLMIDLATLPPGAPDRGRHLRPRQHERRRRGPHRRRGGGLLHPARGGGQRDDPQRHQPRPAGHDPAPGPAGAVAGRPGGDRRHRRRRDRALGLPGHLDAPHRGRGHRARRRRSWPRATR